MPSYDQTPEDVLEMAGSLVVMVCDPRGPALATEADATDLVGTAAWQGVNLVIMPAARLGGDFFQLGSGLAGAVTQKFATYRLRLAVIGDISEHTRRSSALRDFVRESNRGRQLWFLDDAEAVRARLNQA